MPLRDEEFHQVLVVLEYICDVSGCLIGLLLLIFDRREENA